MSSYIDSYAAVPRRRPNNKACSKKIGHPKNWSLTVNYCCSYHVHTRIYVDIYYSSKCSVHVWGTSGEHLVFWTFPALQSFISLPVNTYCLPFAVVMLTFHCLCHCLHCSYCGHGSGREYLVNDIIEQMHCHACPILMGCGSGRLKVFGPQIEPFGVVLQYWIGGRLVKACTKGVTFLLELGISAYRKHSSSMVK